MTEYNLKERIKNFVLWPKSKVVLLNTWNWKLGWIYMGGTFAGWNFTWVEFSLGGIFWVEFSWVEFSWVKFSWVEFSWVEFSWNRQRLWTRGGVGGVLASPTTTMKECCSNSFLIIPPWLWHMHVFHSNA